MLKNHEVESRDHMLSLLGGLNHSADQGRISHICLHSINHTQQSQYMHINTQCVYITIYKERETNM